MLRSAFHEEDMETEVFFLVKINSALRNKEQGVFLHIGGNCCSDS